MRSDVTFYTSECINLYPVLLHTLRNFQLDSKIEVQQNATKRQIEFVCEDFVFTSSFISPMITNF